MMRKALPAVALLLCLAVPATAQQAVQPIFHESPDCMWAADEMFLTATVTAEGESRAYFRIKGAETWCYVVGDRLADRAFFILPEFTDGTTIQYFFLSQQDDIVTGRSDYIYEVQVSEECRRRPARHEEIVIYDCEAAGGIGTAVGAALQIETDPTLTEASPFEPVQ